MAMLDNQMVSAEEWVTFSHCYASYASSEVCESEVTVGRCWFYEYLLLPCYRPSPAACKLPTCWTWHHIGKTSDELPLRTKHHKT